MLERTSSRELQARMVFDQTHDSESWLQTATICQAIFEAMVGSSPPKTHFMPPRRRPPPPPMTPEQIRRNLRLIPC